MRFTYVFFTVLVCISFSAAQTEGTEVIPAGTLLQCTLSEPNFSSKTAAVGDPLLCHLSSLAPFGRPLFPRGAELSGHFESYKNPGHFVGKGWIELQFERLILPNGEILPLPAKIISAPHLKVDVVGRIHGKGHPKRDAVEWMIPVLWPVKLVTLPGRGPYPSLRHETRVTLRVMEDLEIPAPRIASVYPRPSNAHSGYENSVYHQVGPILSLPRQPFGVSISYSGQPSGNDQGEARHSSPTMLILKGGTGFLAVSYWVNGGLVHCVLDSGEEKIFSLDSLDFETTVKLNNERNVQFVVRMQGSQSGQ